MHLVWIKRRNWSKIIVSYILTFIYLNSNCKITTFCSERRQAFPDFRLFLISSCIYFIFIRVVHKIYELCFTPSTYFSYMLVSRNAWHLTFGEKIWKLGTGAEIFKLKSFKILNSFLDKYKLLKVRGNLQ